ncbi:hypothetical protein EFR01_24500 [Sinorhizobium fredii]|nr:hypothetical protein EFR01_24500 [Sinorhizobium fredii]
MVTEIESGAFNRGVYHRQRLDAFLVQGRIELCHCRNMAPAERAMQASKQTDQQRATAAKIIEGDLPPAGDRIEHNVRGPVARL